MPKRNSTLIGDSSRIAYDAARREFGEEEGGGRLQRDTRNATHAMLDGRAGDRWRVEAAMSRRDQRRSRRIGER